MGFTLILQGRSSSGGKKQEVSKGTPCTRAWIYEPNKFHIWVREFIIDEADKVGKN